ncbi:D-alanine--D-alanine ligase [Thiolapillus sp.]|uniref:D-alanine--D-alanine ligase n=1 Tax=Thiolapillus sp. TaxID=2017437 RepID=UPI0025EB44D4|nr:D-alanine--D-alanine ligase [Thiolapillus sp.]
MTVRPQDFSRVAVLMGGWSAEREVSLVSGAAVLAGLRERGVDAHAIDVGRDICEVLKSGNFDRAFIVLHGRGGEDGVIQGVLETLELPYTGTGVLGSALAMDKARSKRLWSGMGLPTPEYILIRGEEDLDTAGALGFPLMVKPVHEGSSIGISKVEDATALQRGWVMARQFDQEVLAERWIDGKEYTVTVLDGEALPVIRLETPHDIYDYAAKYEVDTTGYFIPSGLSEAAEAGMQELALRAFRAVGASGWGRVDIMVDDQGQPWLVEVNTVPGMTGHSLVPMAAAAAGMDFPALVWRILSATLEKKQ